MRCHHKLNGEEGWGAGLTRHSNTEALPQRRVCGRDSLAGVYAGQLKEEMFFYPHFIVGSTSGRGRLWERTVRGAV